MTTQQTDIEKTLKRILVRKLTEWPEGAEKVMLPMIEFSHITRAQWEADRALLASEQARPVGDADKFDQALWDKVAASVAPAVYADAMSEFAKTGCPCENWRDYVASDICSLADAFMAERAKRIAARKASHD